MIAKKIVKLSEIKRSKAQEILDMRVKGSSWTAIEIQLDYHPGSAKRIARMVVGVLDSDYQKDYAGVQIARLEALYETQAELALEGDLGAFKAALSAIKEINELAGIGGKYTEKPKKVSSAEKNKQVEDNDTTVNINLDLVEEARKVMSWDRMAIDVGESEALPDPPAPMTDASEVILQRIKDLEAREIS